MRCDRIAHFSMLFILLAGARAQALTLSPSAPSAKEGQTVTLTSDVAANWSLASGSAGRLTPSADGKSAAYTAPASIIPQNALAGCPVMPNDTVFNTRIDRLPIESHSAAWVGTMSAHSTTLAGFDTA